LPETVPRRSISAFITLRLRWHRLGLLEASRTEKGPGDAEALPFDRRSGILGPRPGSLDYFRRREL